MKVNTLYLSEKLILKACRDLLVLEGFFVVRMVAGLGSLKGVADLYAIKDGVSLWIETKTKKGILSIHQQKFKHDIESHKGIYLVVRDVDELINFLIEINLASDRLF
jgi:Holliday junction resolvase